MLISGTANEMRATTAAARTQPASHTLLADEDAAKSIGRIFVAEERVFQLVP